jgi:hypothetical protein
MLKSGEEFAYDADITTVENLTTIYKPRDIKCPSDSLCGLFTAI